MIEADKVKPNRLQDILFTGTGKKGDNYKFGPVVANSIKIWKTVERRIGGPFKFTVCFVQLHVLGRGNVTTITLGHILKIICRKLKIFHILLKIQCLVDPDKCSSSQL